MSAPLLKNFLNQNALEIIADTFKQADASFDKHAFIALCLPELETLELKQRIVHIIHSLHPFLPKDFCQTAKILRQFAKLWQNQADRHHNYIVWPVIDYVAVYGIDRPEIALPLLKELTPLFSAEFAIRPFIIQHFDATYPLLCQWASDPNEHVRRLACEGIRPRLPWGEQLRALKQQPEAIFPILDTLKNDPSLYVRKSVANNLNDISRDHPDQVLLCCRQWRHNASAKTLWIIERALRSLIKQGNVEALAILGFDRAPAVQLNQLALQSDKLTLGDTLNFAFQLENSSFKEQAVLIDFVIHFVKKNQQRQPKVFKLKKLRLAANSHCIISKSFSFKPISTRRYYAGEQAIEIMLNGQVLAKQSFHLSV